MSLWHQIIELLASAARTASGNGSAVSTLNSRDRGGSARCYLDVTAVSGVSPELDVRVQAVINGTPYTIGTFAQKTATGRESILIEEAAGELRTEWDIAGTTPSFTFSVECHRDTSRSAS